MIICCLWLMFDVYTSTIVVVAAVDRTDCSYQVVKNNPTKYKVLYGHFTVLHTLLVCL